MPLSEERNIAMTELFGLLASLTGLISTGTGLSTQLCQFVDSFRIAPQNAQNLAHELQELCSTLDSLWKIFSGRQPRESDPLLNLQNVLDSCGQRFSELGKFAKAHVVREGDRAVSRQMKRWRWSFQEKEVAALKNQLERHKATLSITLLLSTHRESTSVKGGAAQIRERIRELDNRLIKDGDKAITDAAYASSDVLRRYLECCGRSSVLTSRSSTPVYQKRVSSLLSRVVEDDIQPPYPRSESTPPSNTTLGFGEDIIRSASATSMRPARYGSGRNLHRRHSVIIQKPQPENITRNSDPRLQLREKFHSEKAIEMMGIQTTRKAEVREVKPTDKIWADVRSLVDQNLPHEVLSEQFHQAQLRLEQSRGGTNKQRSGENPERLGLPAKREAAERKITKQPQPQKKPNVVKKSGPKGKAKDEKARAKVEVRGAVSSNSEAKKKTGKEKARTKAAAQKAILEERAAAERAKQAAEYRGLILPGSQVGRLDRNVVSETDLVIERTVEKSKQPSGDGPKPEKTRPLSSAWAPMNTKMSKAHVCKEILDESRIVYTEELDYFIIHQNVSLTDQINLRVRTNEIRGV